jgi:hypothetical protein
LNQKISDEQIVRAVREYRDHPRVKDQHGPASLEELGHFMAYARMVDEPAAKATLSPRIVRLIEQGYLAVPEGMPWRGNGNSDRLFMPGLYVTDRGKALLGGTDGPDED